MYPRVSYPDFTTTRCSTVSRTVPTHFKGAWHKITKNILTMLTSNIAANPDAKLAAELRRAPASASLPVSSIINAISSRKTSSPFLSNLFCLSSLHHNFPSSAFFRNHSPLLYLFSITLTASIISINPLCEALLFALVFSPYLMASYFFKNGSLVFLQNKRGCNFLKQMV